MTGPWRSPAPGPCQRVCAKGAELFSFAIARDGSAWRLRATAICALRLPARPWAAAAPSQHAAVAGWSQAAEGLTST